MLTKRKEMQYILRAVNGRQFKKRANKELLKKILKKLLTEFNNKSNILICANQQKLAD